MESKPSEFDEWAKRFESREYRGGSTGVKPKILPPAVTYSALGGLIHADHPVIDTTLCGDGLEGEGGVHNMSMPCEPQRIRCESCVLLIEYAATIPRKFYRERKRPVRRKQ